MLPMPMHKEILTSEQVEFLPFIAKFKKNFGLVGGTAVALYIGHRESIDFDLFSFESFGNLSLQRKIEATHTIDKMLVNRKGELTFLIRDVKFTFFHYPFDIPFSETFGEWACMPTLLTLAAMKVYAIGMRMKWKDYVDMYFIFRDFYNIQEVASHAKSLFGDRFNEKLFRSQISYFGDINYEEAVVFKPGFEVPDAEIKRALEEYSIA